MSREVNDPLEGVANVLWWIAVVVMFMAPLILVILAVVTK